MINHSSSYQDIIITWAIICSIGFLTFEIISMLLLQKRSKGPMWTATMTSILALINYERMNDWVLELFEKYGNTVSFKILPYSKPVFHFTRSTDNTKHILKSNFENYEKGAFFHNVFDELLGIGIFNSDGHMWKIQRKQASKMFSVNIFKQMMLPTFKTHAHKVMKRLINVTSMKGKVDVQDITSRFTFDSICKIAFGFETNSIELDGAHEFGAAFDRCQANAKERFLSPVDLFIRRLIHPAEYRVVHDINLINNVVFTVIKQRKADPKLEEKIDMLSRFMLLEKEVDEDGGSPSYTDKELRDIVLNFMIAGRDTTSNCISWSIHSLLQYPDVKRKLMSEIISEIGDECDDFTFERLAKLKYMQAFISEVLRLHPSVPLDSKCAVDDDVLPCGTVVKKGEFVVYAPYCQGRDPKIWDNPLEFNPDRFLHPEYKHNPFIFSAFQAGRRVCLGQRMAYLEVTVFLTILLLQCEVELVEGQEDVTYQTSVTLPIKGGLYVRVTEKQTYSIQE